MLRFRGVELIKSSASKLREDNDMAITFYKCATCGNVAVKLFDSGVPMECCGVPMDVLEPNVVEAAHEKHLPVVSVNGLDVQINVGQVDHPMTSEHFITAIAMQTESTWSVCMLKPGDAPHAQFSIAVGDHVVAAYAYCNLHGLWKTTK